MFLVANSNSSNSFRSPVGKPVVTTFNFTNNYFLEKIVKRNTAFNIYNAFVFVTRGVPTLFLSKSVRRFPDLTRKHFISILMTIPVG